MEHKKPVESENLLSIEEKKELSALKNRFASLILQTMEPKDFDLSKVYPETDNLETLYAQLTDLKKCLDSFRPFNPAQLENLQEALDIEYTYESNRIEGSTLTLAETALIISKGLTIQGKSMKEHQEAINHQQAIEYLRELVEEKADLNESVLKEIHALVLQGIDRHNAGAYRKESVRIMGSRHVCPNPLKVPSLMEQYWQFYEDNKETMHPVELAGHLHEKLVTIHPFIDGNGRTARLVMNLLLMQQGYPITIIASDSKSRESYYDALETAQLSETKDNTKFLNLVATYVKQGCFKYLEMVSGDISDHGKNKGYYFFKKIEPYLNS